MSFWTSRRERYDRALLSELDYESLLLTTGDQAFDNWDMVRWKRRVYTPDGRGVEADAVLLHKFSGDWVVVEIELASHSISGHVFDQLERLASAQYGELVTPSLAQASGRPTSDVVRFTRNRPDFLCIADDYTERLAECCAATGFRYAVLEPYRSQQHSGLRLVRMPAQYRERVITTASLRYVLPRGDGVFGHRPFMVPDAFPACEQILVEYENTVHELRVTRIKDARLIFPTSGDWLTGVERLVLSTINVDDGVFQVERSEL